VSFDDLMLALHVLSAFSYVAGVVLFWVLIVAVRRTDTPERTLSFAPASKVGNAAIGIGAGGTIVLVAAIVLWFVAAGVGQRTGKAYLVPVQKAQELNAAGQTGPNSELLALNRTSQGLMLQVIASLVLVLILADMIWKPGA
jgi:hypothetical protein